jgi:hypothetical protein
MAGTGIPLCWMGEGGVRKRWMVLMFLGLTACGPTYPVIKDYCPALGRALTDKERILKGLEYFYNEDERLLRDFPKGTKRSTYAVLHPDNDGRNEKTQYKPPFVPEHFQVEKRAAQKRSPFLNRDKFLQNYYTQFPNCCEVVEAAYRRDTWPSGLLKGYGIVKNEKWIKDVWVKQEYPFRKSENIQARGELNSYICGEIDNSLANFRN